MSRFSAGSDELHIYSWTNSGLNFRELHVERFFERTSIELFSLPSVVSCCADLNHNSPEREFSNGMNMLERGR